MTAGMAMNASYANADAGKAKIVSRHSNRSHPVIVAGHAHAEQVHYLHNAGRRTVAVVTRRVADRSVVVSRALSEQPVHAHLVEMQVGVTTIYLDPHKDYRRQNENAIDENHSILKAIRLADSIDAQKARIIRRKPMAHHHEDDKMASLTTGRQQEELRKEHSPANQSEPDNAAPKTDESDKGVLALAD